MGNSAGANAVLYPNAGEHFPPNVAVVNKSEQIHLWVSPPLIDPTSWDWFITEISLSTLGEWFIESSLSPTFSGVYAPTHFKSVKYQRLLHFLSLKSGSNVSDSHKKYIPVGGFEGNMSNFTVGDADIFTWTADPHYALTGISFKYGKGRSTKSVNSLITYMTFYSSPVIPDSNLPPKSIEFFFGQNKTSSVTEITSSSLIHNKPGKFIQEIGLGAYQYNYMLKIAYASHWKNNYDAAFISWNSVGDLISKSMTKIPKSLNGDRYAIEDCAKLFYKSDNSGTIDVGVDSTLVPQKPYLYDYYNWMLKTWVSSWGDPMVSHADDANPLPALTYCMSTKWAPITNPIGLMNYIKEEVMSRDPSSQLFIQSQSTCWSSVCNGDKRLANRTHLLTTDLVDVECPLPDKVTVCSVTNNIFDSNDIDLKNQKVNQYCGNNDDETPGPKPGSGSGDDIFSFAKPFTDWLMESPTNMTIFGTIVAGVIILMYALFSSSPNFDTIDNNNNDNNNNNDDDDDYYYDLYKRQLQKKKKNKKKKEQEKKRKKSNVKRKK